jgi:hypothetical protein
LKKEVSDLIEQAQELGLSLIDSETALEFLEHREFGLALETVAEQLYEIEIKIDLPFILNFNQLARKMNYPENSFDYLEELLGDDKHDNAKF